MRTRRLLIPTVTAALVLGPALAALANPGGWVDVDADDSEIDVGATDEGSTEGSTEGSDQGSTEGDRPRRRSAECAWTPAPTPANEDARWEVDPTRADGLSDPEDDQWYVVTCTDGAGGEFSIIVPVPVVDAEPVDPTQLRDEAVDTLALPVPTIAMNPSGDQVVHLDTWLWINDAMWQTHSKSASAGGVTATVTATPQRVAWDLGNGDTVVCDGPGVPYDLSVPSDQQATDCSYAYTHTSAGQPGDAFQATATVQWTVAWTVTGAAGGGPLPALFTSSPVAVRVAELQALNQ